MGNIMLGSTPLILTGGGSIKITDYLDNPKKLTSLTTDLVRLLSRNNEYVAFGSYVFNYSDTSNDHATYTSAHFGYMPFIYNYSLSDNFSYPSLFYRSVSSNKCYLYLTNGDNKLYAICSNVADSGVSISYPSGFVGDIWVGKFKLIVQ